MPTNRFLKQREYLSSKYEVTAILLQLHEELSCRKGLLMDELGETKASLSAVTAQLTTLDPDEGTRKRIRAERAAFWQKEDAMRAQAEGKAPADMEPLDPLPAGVQAFMDIAESIPTMEEVRRDMGYAKPDYATGKPRFTRIHEPPEDQFVIPEDD